MQSSKRRSIWLGVNLVTVFIAVFFISLFEATLQEKIALAILMPVVASMGGNRCKNIFLFVQACH
jgi:magnesium transporter